MDLLMRFKWMWRRRKQTQNCAALLYLSTRADIFKRVNHRNLRCYALRGLRCKTVSGTLRGAGKADAELCCPALSLNSRWHIQTCESQKPALPCPAWAALPASQCAPGLIAILLTQPPLKVTEIWFQVADEQRRLAGRGYRHKALNDKFLKPSGACLLAGRPS